MRLAAIRWRHEAPNQRQRSQPLDRTTVNLLNHAGEIRLPPQRRNRSRLREQLLSIIPIGQSPQNGCVRVIGNLAQTAVGKRKLAESGVPAAKGVVRVCLEVRSWRDGKLLASDRRDRG